MMLDRVALPSGRILFLGGTDVFLGGVEVCTFACTFSMVETVHDVVDMYWLQLNGCGVGFQPVPGNLFGFAAPIPKLKIVRSNRPPDWRGFDHNHEFYQKGVWTIQVGDSARAWAKFLGKLVAGKHLNCDKLVVDLSNIRGRGNRLRGYGWISSGDAPLAVLAERAFGLMNGAAGRCLTGMEIHALMNMMGDSLSTRRAAQIGLCDRHEDRYYDFVTFKGDLAEKQANPWKALSNNSVNYWVKPDLYDDFWADLKRTLGNQDGEPGARNMETAQRRFLWCQGTNPCGEVLLPNKGLCNLFEVNIAHRKCQTVVDLGAVMEIAGELNYLNTCVDLRDGILQSAWHENNQNLRLCGVGLAGIVQRPDLHNPIDLEWLRDNVRRGADIVADRFGTPKSQAVTTVKPGGTLPKIMDCTEGMSTPLGRYIFNRVQFHVNDPLVGKLRDANYRIEPHPKDPENAVLVVLPTKFGGLGNFQPTPTEQLELYKLLLTNWCDHNVSCSIYYDGEDEFRSIAKWLWDNWNSWISISMFPRANTAAYDYLPQEVVSKAEFEEYVESLKTFDINSSGTRYEDDELEKCVGGICPTR